MSVQVYRNWHLQAYRIFWVQPVQLCIQNQRNVQVFSLMAIQHIWYLRPPNTDACVLSQGCPHNICDVQYSIVAGCSYHFSFPGFTFSCHYSWYNRHTADCSFCLLSITTLSLLTDWRVQGSVCKCVFCRMSVLLAYSEVKYKCMLPSPR